MSLECCKGGNSIHEAKNVGHLMRIELIAVKRKRTC